MGYIISWWFIIQSEYIYTITSWNMRPVVGIVNKIILLDYYANNEWLSKPNQQLLPYYILLQNSTIRRRAPSSGHSYIFGFFWVSYQALALVVEGQEVDLTGTVG